jgi:hypothetical protein
MRSRFAFLVLSILPACAGVSSYARATAGRIGCPAADIEIRDEEADQPGPRSWVAACQGKRYACSSSGDLADSDTRVKCSEIGAQ